MASKHLLAFVGHEVTLFHEALFAELALIQIGRIDRHNVLPFNN
jgi:hypothetical protein